MGEDCTLRGVGLDAGGKSKGIGVFEIRYLIGSGEVALAVEVMLGTKAGGLLIEDTSGGYRPIRRRAACGLRIENFPMLARRNSFPIQFREALLLFGIGRFDLRLIVAEVVGEAVTRNAVEVREQTIVIT